MLSWRAPGDRDRLYIGGWRALAKQREQAFEGCSLSLCEHFNAAIGGIVSVATEAEVQGMLDNEMAKADAVHKAGDLYKNFFRWLLIALAHGIHISIIL